jgi:3D (Asp-Asp-Asp) domain-containing protein
MKMIFISLFILFSINENTSVTVTVYHAVPEQCNSDPGHTASMFKLNLSDPYSHKIIAVSRDLLKKYPFGSCVVVKGTDYDGTYQVQDLLNKRYKKRIDILINLDMPIGKWTNATITETK